jgi:carboxypeptidase Taq
VPARLAAELARVTTLAHGDWVAARAARRFDLFAPVLARIVDLKREEAACLREPGADLYDALIDGFEPGMTTARAAALLGALRPRLVALAQRVAATGRIVPGLAGAFPEAAQLALAREAAGAFGYDWQAGRLDLVVHPFCSGTLGDVRITTRVDPASPFECLYGTIHETGHAIYEQGLDPGLALQPAGEHVSMGVHESQSRLCENQIGRSRPFMDWLWPRMRAAFGDFGLDGPEALWRAVNRVEPGFRRTEADEVHYNLHILMRFDLERALIAGDLAVAGLEAAWNDRFRADFGREVPHAALGVLQDVHWSAGLFGYFPTYSFGNIYAAELHAALRRDLPDLDARVGAGELGGVVAWLRDKIHRQGRLAAPEAIVAAAIGHAPQPGALLDYLEAKFGALYGF